MNHKPFIQTRPSSHRPARYAQRLREELSLFIPKKIKDPVFFELQFLTITDVSISNDLKNGKVLFSLMGQENLSARVEKALANSAPFIRRELMRRLESKFTPRLTFKFDRGIEHSANIDAILKEISNAEA